MENTGYAWNYVVLADRITPCPPGLNVFLRRNGFFFQSILTGFQRLANVDVMKPQKWSDLLYLSHWAICCFMLCWSAHLNNHEEWNRVHCWIWWVKIHQVGALHASQFHMHYFILLFKNVQKNLKTNAKNVPINECSSRLQCLFLWKFQEYMLKAQKSLRLVS
jgi:hypothetical protein